MFDRLAVAQRYSVLVTARNDTSANWAIHANMDTDMFDTVPDDLNPSTFQPSHSSLLASDSFVDATALISYSSSNSLTTPNTVDEYLVTNDTALEPIPAIAQYDAPDRTIELLVFFDTMTDGTNRAMFNE